MIGRWSELRVVSVCKSESKAMLKRMRSVFVKDSVIKVPHASASVLVVLEYQGYGR